MFSRCAITLNVMGEQFVVFAVSLISLKIVICFVHQFKSM